MTITMNYAKPIWMIYGVDNKGCLLKGCHTVFESYASAEAAAVNATRETKRSYRILESIAFTEPPPEPPIRVQMQRSASLTAAPWVTLTPSWVAKV